MRYILSRYWDSLAIQMHSLRHICKFSLLVWWLTLAKVHWKEFQRQYLSPPTDVTTSAIDVLDSSISHPWQQAGWEYHKPLNFQWCQWIQFPRTIPWIEWATWIRRSNFHLNKVPHLCILIFLLQLYEQHPMVFLEDLPHKWLCSEMVLVKARSQECPLHEPSGICLEVLLTKFY